MVYTTMEPEYFSILFSTMYLAKLPMTGSEEWKKKNMMMTSFYSYYIKKEIDFITNTIANYRAYLLDSWWSKRFKNFSVISKYPHKAQYHYLLWPVSFWIQFIRVSVIMITYMLFSYFLLFYVSWYIPFLLVFSFPSLLSLCHQVYSKCVTVVVCYRMCFFSLSWIVPILRISTILYIALVLWCTRAWQATLVGTA
jgi:hypothetical protein